MELQTLAQLYDLSGRTAIVTGGAMGIGQAIALRLSEAGARIMIADIAEEASSRTVERIKADGGTAKFIVADAGKAADAERVVRSTVDAYGTVDILVNNAGIYPLAPLLEISEELWDRTHDVNLKGVFFYSKAAALQMISAGHSGRIINIASIDSLHPDPNVAHYSAAKGGLIMLTKALALELAPHGILVNAVAPGDVQTPGTEAILEAMGASADEVLETLLPRLPLGRAAQSDDVAKVVLFLAGGAADYMTGTVVLVDGGRILT
jgi:2-deoxy-D-gluconate 3-dehydrogenase